MSFNFHTVSLEPDCPHLTHPDSSLQWADAVFTCDIQTRSGLNFGHPERFVHTALTLAPLLLDNLKLSDDRARRTEAIYDALSPLAPLSFESPEFGPGDSHIHTPSLTPAAGHVANAAGLPSHPASSSTKALLFQTSARLMKHEVTSRRDKLKAKYNRYRKESYDLKKMDKGSVNRKIKSQTSKKNSGYEKVITLTDFKIADISIAPGGDIGRHRPAGKTLPTLASLMARPGWRYIPNDGRCVMFIVGLFIIVQYYLALQHISQGCRSRWHFFDRDIPRSSSTQLELSIVGHGDRGDGIRHGTSAL